MGSNQQWVVHSHRFTHVASISARKKQKAVILISPPIQGQMLRSLLCLCYCVVLYNGFFLTLKKGHKPETFVFVFFKKTFDTL